MKKLFLILLCCALLMSGCTFNRAAQESGGKITFTDALGREVTVTKNPRKVAALLGSFADIWCLAGGSLCAAPEDAWEDFGLESDTAANIGGAHSPNTELLLAAAPELVLASASTASNIALLETLEAVGITVVYFDVDNFEDYLQMLDICTDITDRKDLYESNGLLLQRQIEAIKQELSQEAVPDEQRTVLLLRASSGFVKAKGSSGTILGEMLKDLGCINIADSDRSLLEDLSVEAVIREQPYRIFAVTMGSNTQAAIDSLNALLQEDPAWGTLEAVTAGRLHIMDKNLYNLKPNRRWAEAYEKLFDILTENGK